MFLLKTNAKTKIPNAPIFIKGVEYRSFIEGIESNIPMPMKENLFIALFREKLLSFNLGLPVYCTLYNMI